MLLCKNFDLKELCHHSGIHSMGNRRLGVGLLLCALLISAGQPAFLSAWAKKHHAHPKHTLKHSGKSKEKTSKEPAHHEATWTVPILQKNYEAWRDKYIEPNGMVYAADWSNKKDSSTGHYAHQAAITEGQSYAMYMSYLMGDKEAFEQVWTWTKAHMQRPDHLFSWWVSLDPETGKVMPITTRNATDGDILIAHSLLAAGKRWHNPGYVAEAKQVIDSLWENTVVESHGRYYVASETVKGPQTRVAVDPSYLMPYAFRAFASVDPKHPWNKLANDSYFVLNEASAMHRKGLPPDWCSLAPATGQLTLQHNGQFSIDARRVFWHVSYDASLGNKQAKAYLRHHRYLVDYLERGNEEIPVRISADGEETGSPRLASWMNMPALAQMNALSPPTAKKYYVKLATDHDFWQMPDSYFGPAITWFSMYAMADSPARKKLAIAR